MGFDLQIKFNLLPGLPAAVRHDIGGVVKKTTLSVEADAKRRSRVDTGQMRAGWESTFEDDLTGTVSNAVEHAIYNEWGTHKMSAQPMIRPAIEDHRESFNSECSAVLRKQGK